MEPHHSLPPVVAADAAGLRRASAAVRGGGVIGYPTETLYGLGALALRPESLQRLAVLKGRAAGNPMSVLLADASQLPLLVAWVPVAAQVLAERYWPGPLTLVLPARPELPAQLLGEGGGVGVRVPSDWVALALLRAIGEPLTATSANPSGAKPATNAEAARLPGLELVLDDGPRDRPPSTVVAVLDERPRLLRQGEIVLEGVR